MQSITAPAHHKGADVSTDASAAPTDTAAEMATAIEAMSEDKPQSDQATEQDATTAQQTEAPDYFGDNFDPQTLPPELQPAYKQLQGAWTRKTQDLAEQRKQTQWQQDLVTDLQSEDPQAKQNALEWMAQNGLLTEEQVAQVFGYEFEQDDQLAEPDPNDLMRSEWEQFKAERQAQQQQAQQDAFVQKVDDDAGEQLAKIASDLGRELPQRTQELLVSRALVAHVKPDGMLDIHAALAELQQEWQESQQGWVASKETTTTQPGGRAATEVPDLDNPEQRQEHMAAQLAALDQARSA